MFACQPDKIGMAEFLTNPRRLILFSAVRGVRGHWPLSTSGPGRETLREYRRWVMEVVPVASTPTNTNCRCECGKRKEYNDRYASSHVRSSVAILGPCQRQSFFLRLNVL